jgi:ribosomal protein L7/L12
MNPELQIQAVRERVAKLEAEMRFLYKHLNVTFTPTFELDPADKEVAEWLKKGNELKAIAEYRAIHLVGMNEAKAAVDEIRAGLGLGF